MSDVNPTQSLMKIAEEIVTAVGVVTALDTLSRLRNEQSITEDEYQTIKAKLIDRIS